MSKMRKEYDPNKVKRRKRKPIVYIMGDCRNRQPLFPYCTLAFSSAL